LLRVIESAPKFILTLVILTNYDRFQQFTNVEFGNGIDMEFPGTGTPHVYTFSRNFQRSSPLVLLVKDAM